MVAKHKSSPHLKGKFQVFYPIQGRAELSRDKRLEKAVEGLSREELGEGLGGTWSSETCEAAAMFVSPP